MPIYKDPVPRQPSCIPQEEFWETAGSIELPITFSYPNSDLFSLLEQRKSRRSFGAVTIQDISTLLWFTQRRIGVYPGDSGRVKAPLPTAGALSSLKTIIVGSSNSAWLYNGRKQHKGEFLPISESQCNSIRRSASNYLDIGEGTLLLFFASRYFISEYYDSPDSLVLRDSGVVIGGMALIAEALGLAFCPLGTMAQDWVCSILDCSEERVVPGGAAVIGRR